MRRARFVFVAFSRFFVELYDLATWSRPSGAAPAS